MTNEQTNGQNTVEQAILGTLINEPKYLDQVGITPEHFAFDENRKIYNALNTCYDKEKKQIDTPKILSKLGNNLFDYYMSVQDSYVSDKQLEFYVRDLDERYKRRCSDNIQEEYTNGLITYETYMNKLARLNETSLYAEKEVLPTPEEIYQMITADKKYLELRTYKYLGEKMRYRQNTLNVIGARTSVGKSAFCLNLMNDISQNKKYKCMYFNLEMDQTELYERLISMNARIKVNDLKTKKLDEIGNTWQDILSRDITFKHGNLYIENLSNVILQEQKRKENANKHFVIFIDYLGLIRTRRRVTNDREKIGQFVRDIHAIMKDRQCTVFLLAQVNRSGAVNKENHAQGPTVENLKDSGEIEQTAHSVILLRDLTYEKAPNTSEQSHLMLLDIAKNRSGDKGNICMKYHHETQLFTEMPKSQAERELAELQK